jgi:hypothetical protein
MADAEDIQPLVCDNGTGMVKVLIESSLWYEFWFDFNMQSRYHCLVGVLLNFRSFSPLLSFELRI